MLRTVGGAAGCFQKNLETGQFRRAELEGLIMILERPIFPVDKNRIG